MDVQMRNGLPCRRAVVDPDVIALRAELHIQLQLFLAKEIEGTCSFGFGDLEEGCDVATGNDQRVSRGDGVRITDNEHETVLGDDSGCGDGAEWAGHGFI